VLKSILTVIGVVLLLSGLVWIGQGSGYLPWPPESFMINESRWIYYGAATAVVGLIVLVAARRR